MTSVIRDKSGRYVPLVRPKQWKDGSIRRSRDRTERIARAKTQQKAWLTTTEWISSVDDRTIAALEAEGIPWSAVLRWLDEVNPREAFTARMLVSQALRTFADSEATSLQRREAHRHLYVRLIAAGIME